MVGRFCLAPLPPEAGAETIPVSLILDGSPAPSKLNNPSPIPFGRLSGWKLLPLPRRSAFGGDLLSHLFTLLGFAIESLSFGCRTANLTQPENVDFKIAAVVGHLQPISDAHFSGGFGGLTVRPNSSQVASVLG